MLQRFGVQDSVLGQKIFIRDEVQFNLIHRICEAKSSICLKSSDDSMIFAQSEGQNAWLWISRELADDHRSSLVQELVELLKGTALSGVSGDPMIVEHFVQVYSTANSLQYFSNMLMQSYSCSVPKKPTGIKGTIHRATIQNVDCVAQFLAGFIEGAHGITVDPASQIAAAEEIIEAGSLYLWMVDGEPVSMANIGHRSPRHARINAVYTPAEFRKKGYASAVVAEVCSIILESESLEPVLYADLKNPDSNKVYQNIGFVERGKVIDIKFKEEDL